MQRVENGPNERDQARGWRINREDQNREDRAHFVVGEREGRASSAETLTESGDVDGIGTDGHYPTRRRRRTERNSMKMWVMVGAEIVGEGDPVAPPARPGTHAGKGKKSRVRLGLLGSERSS